VIGRCVTPTALDIGWTGLAHDADTNDIIPSRLVLECEGPAPCGECAIVDLDPVFLNCRCANDNRAICFDPFAVSDQGDCGGAACECYFGPPVPLVAGNVPTCVLPRVTRVGGTANVDEGSGSIEFDLEAVVHLGGGLLTPCPYCDADRTPGDGAREGVCVGGLDDGRDCDAESGNSTFPAPGGGRATLDCFPDPGTNVSGAGLHIDVVLSTGQSTLTSGVPCSSAPGAPWCPCGVCSLDPTRPCFCDADCGDAGTCDAPTGTAMAPNACDGGRCEDVGNGEGACPAGPQDRYCDGVVRPTGKGLISCATNADCAPEAVGVDAGACAIAQARPCFLVPIRAQGAPSPVAPLGAALFCAPPTNSVAVNSATGLPGPGRLVLQSALQLFCASDPTVAYQPGVGGCPPAPEPPVAMSR
jgi:hypothetical protein